MNQRWIVLSLLSGLALSQVPTSKLNLTPGKLYRLHVAAWPSSPTPVTIRQHETTLATKTLTPFDPDFTFYWRANSGATPAADLPLTIESATDPLATESSPSQSAPILIDLDREYHALNDERPFFTGKPAEGIHWYQLRNTTAQPRIAYLSVHVTDRDLPSDIETFTRDENGAWTPYREGGYRYTPEATQTMPGLSSFRVRRLEPGVTYLLRVASQHPTYTLTTRTYSLDRTPAQSLRMGMDFLASLGASWHANIPRRGAVATRETLPHTEIQGCVACHPTVFTLRGYDTATSYGHPGPNPAARATLEQQLRNHPRPFPGHPGVSWTRTIFSARAISARASAWTQDLLPYLKLAGTETWAEEADGAAPNVSPFEIAHARYLALKEPVIAQRIATEPANNTIDLNWKLLGLAASNQPTAAAIEKLFEAQRPDGFFAYELSPTAPPSEFITWHALYALAKAGLKRQDARVDRLYRLCLSRQQPSGEWHGAPTAKAFDTPFRDTQFAVMALAALTTATPETITTPTVLTLPGKVGAIEAAAQLRQNVDAKAAIDRLNSANPLTRYEGIRIFSRHFRAWTFTPTLLPAILARITDAQPLVRFEAANAAARWYTWQADSPAASQILSAIANAIPTETDTTVQSALKQALYAMLDENEGYLATWTSQLPDEASEQTLAGLNARRARIQAALAAALSQAAPASRHHILEALWDHPQRHAGLPADLEGRSEVVLPAYFTEYTRGVDHLHDRPYEPHTEATGFRYNPVNPFFKTRIGNDSELPDLGTVTPTLETQLLACLESKDGELNRAALRALSIFPEGLSGPLAIAVVRHAAGPLANDVEFLFANDARGRLNLELPYEFQKPLVEALLAALQPGAGPALRTLLPALAAVPPGEGPTRDPHLQGRMESLMLKPAGVPIDLALAAGAAFPHIADGPLIRTLLLEAFTSNQRPLESAAVEIFVRSYIAEPTNPVLGKQFADKASPDIRRRMVDALDPTRFTLRLSALNRYNPGRDVVLPEDANLFSSDVARHLLNTSVNTPDPQLRRATAELIWSNAELAFLRPRIPAPSPVQPDYEYFRQKVQPILARVGSDGRACVVCHATQGQFPLRMAGKTGFTEAQSRFNYESALSKIHPTNPKLSLILLKPTRPNDNAGDPALHTSTHGGGTRWGRDTREASASEDYETILNWIRGAKLP